jgi:hypothetical protein
MDVKPGQVVSLDASESSDPDGDALSYRWFVYKEAGTWDGDVAIDRYATPKATLRMPEAASSKTIHVILEVRDNGNPSLYSYRRIVLTIQP